MKEEVAIKSRQTEIAERDARRYHRLVSSALVDIKQLLGTTHFEDCPKETQCSWKRGEK